MEEKSLARELIDIGICAGLAFYFVGSCYKPMEHEQKYSMKDKVGIEKKVEDNRYARE